MQAKNLQRVQDKINEFLENHGKENVLSIVINCKKIPCDVNFFGVIVYSKRHS